MDSEGREPIDWRKTVMFTLWLCSPVVVVLGLYLLANEVFAYLVFG